MENLELIEKYVTGKLYGPERDAFESQLKNDTSLQSDVGLQKEIIGGIRSARITALKTMLNQVPVSGVMQSGISAVKVITGAVAAAVIITGSVFYFRPVPKETLTAVRNELPATGRNPKKDPVPLNPKGVKPSSATSDQSKEVKGKPA